MLPHQLRLEQNVLVASDSEAPRPHCTYPKVRDGHVQSDGLGGPDTVNTVKSFWQL